jgi:hypothetical protein
MQQRRSTWAAGIAGGLVVLAVGGVIHYATASGSSSPQQQRQTLVPPHHRRGYGELLLGVPYGTARKQVLRQLGPPTKQQASCWIYRGRVGRIRGRYSDSDVDAMKFCFSEGPAGGKAVTQIFSHYAAHTIVRTDPVTHAVTKTSYAAQWGLPLAIEPVPAWYVQQST